MLLWKVVRYTWTCPFFLSGKRLGAAYIKSLLKVTTNSIAALTLDL